MSKKNLFNVVPLTRETYVCPTPEEVPLMRRDVTTTLVPSAYDCIYEAPHDTDDARQILKFTGKAGAKNITEIRVIIKDCEIEPKHFCLFYDPVKHTVYAALYIVEDNFTVSTKKLRLLSSKWLSAIWNVNDARCRAIYAAGNWDTERNLPMLPTKLLMIKEQTKAAAATSSTGMSTQHIGDSSLNESQEAKRLAEIQLKNSLDDLFASSMTHIDHYSSSVAEYIACGPTMCAGSAHSKNERNKFNTTQYTKSNSAVPSDLDNIGFFQVDASNVVANFIVDTLIKKRAPAIIGDVDVMQIDSAILPQIQLSDCPKVDSTTVEMASKSGATAVRAKRNAVESAPATTTKRARAADTPAAAAEPLSSNDSSLFVHWLTDSVLKSDASPLSKTPGTTSSESEQLVWSRAGFLLGSQHKDAPNSDANIKKALSRAADMVAQRGEYEAGSELSKICKDTSILDVMCKRTPVANKLITGVIAPCLTLGAVALLQQMEPAMHAAQDATLSKALDMYHDKKVVPLQAEIAAATQQLVSALPENFESDGKTLQQVCEAVLAEVNELRAGGGGAAQKINLLDQPVGESDLF